MSVIMCAVVTAAGTGIHDGYADRFFKAWVFAFTVGVLAAFTMVIGIQKQDLNFKKLSI